jgi:DNA-binding IclR family transcriptional regulator
MNPLHKIFAIIETVVAHQDKGATYSDILSSLELPKSTVHRILKDLTEVGYLTYHPENKKYFGSLRLANLGAEVMGNFELRKHVRPFLIELHRETEHTANLGILDGLTGVFLDKIEAKDFGIKLFSEIGKTFPLYCTGLGKVFLAYSSRDLLDQLMIRPLDALTDKTITRPARLEKELSKIREQGFAIDDEEITRGIVCVAAPVFSFDQSLAAAISIAFPAYIKKERGLEGEIGAIRKFSRLISESLGNKKIEKTG